MNEQLVRLLSREFRELKLEDWQLGILDSWWSGNNIALNKSRRIGFSYVMAVGAMLKVMAFNEYEHTFISKDEREASNKIRECRKIYYQIAPQYRKKLKQDNVTSLVFVDDVENKGRVSIIRSFPATALRGPKGDITFDEAAFIPKFDLVYDGSLAATLSTAKDVKMVLAVGSTPFGNSGRFYEILTDKNRFRSFKRYTIPWWYSERACRDIDAALAANCSQLDTTDRVRQFGTDELLDIFYNQDLISFQQEMECLFMDSEASYISLEEIMKCTPMANELGGETLVPKAGQQQQCCYELDSFILGFPESLLSAGYELYAGMDIGRHRNVSELLVGLHHPQGEGRRKVHVVGLFTFRNMPFDKQKEALQKLITALPIRRIYLDKTGLGEDIAEWGAKKYGSSQFYGVNFTLATKAELALGLKMAFERTDLLLPPNRELQRQIHSIQRKAGNAGQFQYNAKNEGDSHADKFWALALMNLAVGYYEQGIGRSIIRDIEKMPKKEIKIDPQQKILREVQGSIQQQNLSHLFDKYK